MVQRGASSAAKVESGPVWVAYLFLFSLTVPSYLPIGSVLLMPHRILLLICFIPFFFQLFVFRSAGRVLLADWLLFGSALWAALALFANHPAGLVIEAAGIHIIEFFGAYLLARVTIRSGADFRKMVWVFFIILAVILPLAALESVTKRNIVLDLVPGPGPGPIYGMGERMGMRRAQVVFAHPILFGVFASTGFGLFWYALRPRWLKFIGAPVSALATFFSLSTGALISVVMQSGFIGWEVITKFIRARWRIFAVGSIIGYFVLDAVATRSPFHVLVNYASFSTGSAYNRIHIWNFGTQNVYDNPLFGLGLNNWERPSWMGDSVDNFWLLMAMRYGIPAIVMILLALVLILRQVARADLANENDSLARAGYLVVFGGLFIAGGTVHYWHAMMAFVMFIYGSGVWAATSRGGPPDEGESVEDEAPPRRVSRYTRQQEWGRPIGATATQRSRIQQQPTASRPRRASAGRAQPRRAP